MEEDGEFNTEELKFLKADMINENNDPAAAPLILGWLILLLGTSLIIIGIPKFESRGYSDEPDILIWNKYYFLP